MQKKIWIKGPITQGIILSVIILSAVLFVGCNKNQHDDIVVKIDHGNLIFEVNKNLETRFSTIFPDTKPIINSFQTSEKLEVNNKIIGNFKFNTIVEESLKGELSGKRWIINGTYADSDLSINKELILTIYDAFPDLISTKVIYINTSNDDIFLEEWVNNEYSILSQEDSPLFWAFQGSSSTKRLDCIKPIESGYYQKNYMGMNDTDYGGGIPVTSIWRPDINIAVGHLALVPKLVNLPTEIPVKSKDVKISVTKDFEERTLFKSKESVETLETFISVTKGDYFNNLERYSNLMQAKGIKMVEPEDAAFESIWCAWGYERNFTIDEIIGTLPKVKELVY